MWLKATLINPFADNFNFLASSTNHKNANINSRLKLTLKLRAGKIFQQVEIEFVANPKDFENVEKYSISVDVSLQNFAMNVHKKCYFTPILLSIDTLLKILSPRVANRG